MAIGQKNLRRCAKCHKVLPLEQFTFNKRKKLGRSYACRTCDSKRIRECRARRKTEINAAQLEKHHAKLLQMACAAILAGKPLGKGRSASFAFELILKHHIESYYGYEIQTPPGRARWNRAVSDLLLVLRYELNRVAQRAKAIRADEKNGYGSGDVLERLRALRMLGLQSRATEVEIREAYKRIAFNCHPDRGGDVEDMQMLNKALVTLTGGSHGKESGNEDEENTRSGGDAEDRQDPENQSDSGAQESA